MNTKFSKTVLAVICFNLFITNSIFAQLPDPGFKIDNRTAIVITDPQNDFLSKNGIAWGLVGPSVEKKQHHKKH